MIGRIRNTGMQWAVEIARGGRAPVTRSNFAGKREPYSGDELREIRRRNGVGRPPAIMSRRLAAMGCMTEPHGRIIIGLARLISPLSEMETPDNSDWNLPEWNRKQRRGETLEDWRARRAP